MDASPQEVQSLDEQAVFPTELSSEAQRKLDAILRLLEPCASRQEYGRRLREEADKLGISKRTLQRYKRQWHEKGLIGLADDTRSDKGKSRMASELQKLATKLFKNRNRNGVRLNRKDIYKRVRQHAIDQNLSPPGQSTVYDYLKPLYEAEELKKSIRSPGWQGEKLILNTKDGDNLNVEESNQVWQIDHTPADILVVDEDGNMLGCPWLTTVVDSYSRCIVGFHTGFDAPSSKVVALALRHAILPKRYPESYSLKEEWGTFGLPQHIYTDNGKDFRSDHAQQIAGQLGFTWHYRSRPSEGGIVERPFRTLNQQVWSKLEGYKGSNVQERPEGAENYAIYTLKQVRRGLVRYIVHQYNQDIDHRTHQTRYQRWEAGLIHTPALPSERELDICLMKQATRRVQRGGHISFENIVYKGENLAGYAGKQVALRFDPDNLGIIYIYRYHQNQEVFLSRGFPLISGLENRSLKEWKAAKETLGKARKPLTSDNVSSHFEREATAPQKTMRQRRKAAQRSNKQTLPVVKDDLQEELGNGVMDNPLLDLELSYEDDLFE
ncbi:transposase [filamentous cyanobacterium CCP2]|nr:transposase [filamentous cyanobacterium CCP2]